MLDRTIGYLCAAHRRTGAGALTIVRGEWAYCAAGVADGHDWQRVAPTSLLDLDIARLGTRSTARTD